MGDEDAVQMPSFGQLVFRELSLCEYLRMAKMVLLKALGTALLLPPLGLGLVTNAQNGSEAPIVTIKNGTYEGRYEPTYGTDYFLGMPYAQPPVGM